MPKAYTKTVYQQPVKTEWYRCTAGSGGCAAYFKTEEEAITHEKTHKPQPRQHGPLVYVAAKDDLDLATTPSKFDCEFTKPGWYVQFKADNDDEEYWHHVSRFEEEGHMERVLSIVKALREVSNDIP